MKIINIEANTPVVYIQKKNLKAIAKFESRLPKKVVRQIAALESLDYDEHDEEFVRIPGKKEAKFIDSLSWIPNYKKLRSLTDAELELLIEEEKINLTNIYNQYTLLAPQEPKLAYQLQKDYAKKNQTIKDLNALLWARQGKYDLPIEIPLEIDSSLINIKLDQINCRGGISLDKKKILFTKNNNQPFTEQDRIPMPIIQSATMIIAIEAGLLSAEQGSCNVKTYTDSSNRFFIQEFEEVNIKSPEQQVQIQSKSPLTRVKQKTRLSDAFKKIINPTKKDVEQ